jgi:hypothetical protein
MVEEGKEFLVTVSGFTLSEYLSGDTVESGKQGGGSMSLAVVRYAFNISQPKSLQRLSSIEGLNVTFLIDAENHGFIRWVEIQPDNITNLLYEERIGRMFEMFLSVRLNPKGFPNPMYRRL